MSSGYTLAEASEILGLSRGAITRLIDAGFVSPARGARREYRFGFQDLVVLRAAQGLAHARLPSRRISRSLKRLREQLPAEVPVRGLRILAVGNAVVVSQGTAQWQVDDGQYLLAFDVAGEGRRVEFLDRPAEALPASADERFADACALEEVDVEAAASAYAALLAEAPACAAAYVNLGRLLHTQGRLDQADRVYREGLEHVPGDALLLFNRAVLLGDLERAPEAIALYRTLLEHEPEFADAHYNLALLYQAVGREKEALRHLNAFRRLERA